VPAGDVTGVDGGDSLARDPWQAGDLARVDRGDHQPRVILERFARGVGASVRWNPTAMPLFVRPLDADAFDPTATRVDVAQSLRAQSGDTVRLPVWLRAGRAGGTPCVSRPRRRRRPVGGAGKPPNARGEPRVTPPDFWPAG